MRASIHLFAVVSLLSASSACGGSAARVERQRLARTLEEMRLDMLENQARIEELSNRVFVLRERLENEQQTGVERIDDPQTEVERVDDRPELAVVKLVPDGPAPEKRSVPVKESPQSQAELVDEDPIVITQASLDRLDGLPVRAVPPPPRIRQKKAHTRVSAVSNNRRSGDELFREALKAYREGKLDAAYDRFASFVAAHPRHGHADNAVFWMGECRYDREDYHQAIVEYSKIVENYPRSKKVPDVLLKIGLAHERLGEAASARQAFLDLVGKFPHSAMADLARGHLQAEGENGGAR